MALLNSPEVLIADEPTSNLDVTIQKKIIDDCVIIPIFFESQILVTRKNVDLGRGVKNNIMNSPYWSFYWLEEVDIH